MADRSQVSLSGRAEQEVVKKGTASEHTAIVLTTDDGERLILQRIGGNPFEDAETKQLAGHVVRVEGFRLGDIFRYKKAERDSDA
jgi:hypothetical protein